MTQPCSLSCGLRTFGSDQRESNDLTLNHSLKVLAHSFQRIRTVRLSSS